MNFGSSDAELALGILEANFGGRWRIEVFGSGTLMLAALRSLQISSLVPAHPVGSVRQMLLLRMFLHIYDALWVDESQDDLHHNSEILYVDSLCLLASEYLPEIIKYEAFWTILLGVGQLG